MEEGKTAFYFYAKEYCEKYNCSIEETITQSYEE